MVSETNSKQIHMFELVPRYEFLTSSIPEFNFEIRDPCRILETKKLVSVYRRCLILKGFSGDDKFNHN